MSGAGMVVFTPQERYGDLKIGDEVEVTNISNSDFIGMRARVTNILQRLKSPIEIQVVRPPPGRDSPAVGGLFYYYALNLRKLSLLELMAEAASDS